MKNSFSITRILFSLLMLHPVFSFSITEVLKVKVSGNNYYDETAIRFIQGATQGFDSNWDAHKFFSLNPNVPQIYTRCGITDFAISALPPVSTDTTVELHIIIPASGVYTILGIPFGVFPQGTTILLEDLSDGSTYNLLSNISHPFQMDTASYGAPVRFVVHFDYPVLTAVDADDEKTEPVNVFVSGDHTISILDITNSNKTISILTAAGQSLVQIQSDDNETEIEIPSSATGIVLVRIQVGDRYHCKKLFIK